MNGDLRDLDVIQHWMQAVITHPGGIEAGIRSDEAKQHIDIDPESIEGVVHRSKAMTSIDRLAVYGNAYYIRLFKCLQDCFPAVVKTVGRELFDEFTFGYLQRYPSGSHTLGRLSDNFVRYLKETPRLFPVETPPKSLASCAHTSWPDFVIELAHFEWTLEQVFDGPGVERKTLLTAGEIQGIGQERWPMARLVPVECLRLLHFSYPINDYYTSFRRGSELVIASPNHTYVLLTRRDYIVRRYSLSKPQFTLLCALSEGETVGAAIEQAAELSEDLDLFASQLADWFQQWAALRFFERIE